MNPDPRAQEAAHRVYAALLLWSRGFVPWPLRSSPAEHRTENWLLLRRLYRLGAAHAWSRAAIETLLDSFERPCQLQILTGAAIGVVAVNCWTVEGEMWVCLNLPDTPAVLTNQSGLHCFYRSPSEPVPTRHAEVAFEGDRTLIRVHGDWDAVTVPPSECDAIETWPTVDALPVFEPAWLGVGLGGPGASPAEILDPLVLQRRGGVR